MNINVLRTYVRVVESQNLSRTAEEFGISQPAVTKQIQSLEDYYGVLLLERSGRRLRTTEAGETLYLFARDIIKLADKTDKAMREAAESHKGSLCLGASTIPGQYIMPNLLKEFKERFPYISISLDIADSERIFARVADRELDVGVVGAWLNNRKVEGFKLLDDDLLVVVPEGHPLAKFKSVEIKNLLNERWIFREKGSGTRKAIEEMLAAYDIRKEDLNVYIEAGSTEAVLASVDSGMGISIVSRLAVRGISPRRGIKTIPLANAGEPRSFFVIYPRQKNRRKSVLEMLDFLREVSLRRQG